MRFFMVGFTTIKKNHLIRGTFFVEAKLHPTSSQIKKYLTEEESVDNYTITLLHEFKNRRDFERFQE